MGFFSISGGALHHTMRPAPDAVRLVDNPTFLLPPLITQAHRAFKAWGDAGWSPAPLTPPRVWLTPQGEMAVEYRGDTRPVPLMHVGVAPDLAAWLVMLSQWMETFVVVARARTLWDPEALAGALTFTTPAYLPRELVQRAPGQWEIVAAALAQAVLDGPLPHAQQERYWQNRAATDA